MGKLQKSKRYNDAVEEAIKLVQVREKAKMKIAKIAYSVCDVIIGGHVSGDVYSLTMFAQDIGVNRKTLSDWVHNYEIKIQLEKELKKEEIEFFKEDTPQTQAELNKIRNVLRAQEGGLKKNITKEKVRQAFNETKYQNDDDRLLMSFRKYISNAEYQICHHMDLEYVDQAELAKIHEFSRLIASKLDKYFAVYEKPKVTLRKLDVKERAKRERSVRKIRYQRDDVTH